MFAWRKSPQAYRMTVWTSAQWVAYFRKNGATVILDLSFTKFLPIGEMREHHDYAFALQRQSPDSIFGHWLQFEPHRALESIREFDRALAANAGFIGLCVNGQVTRVSASDPLWDPFYQLSMEANRPIMILTGLTEEAALEGAQGEAAPDRVIRSLEELFALPELAGV